MSRSSTNSLSDPSTSQNSGSLLLSNPIHVGAVNNTSYPHNLASLSSLEASGSTYSDRPVLSEAAVPRVLSQPQESFSQSRYSQQNPSPVVPSLGSHLGLYNVSNPCPVPFPEAGQSQLGPLTSRSTPLPPQFAQPMHSSLVSFQPPVVGLPLARPFGHDTRPPAPWQSNVGSTVSTAPFDPRLHLSLSDVWFDPSGSIRLLIKSSKTDPFRRGVLLSIGPSGNSLCPVSALRHYLQLRGFAPGPLFVSSLGCPLSPFLVNSWLRSILATVGISGHYSSHSFRIGAATCAAAAGVPDHLIKTLGRWSSNAYQLYIRTPPHVLSSVAAVLAQRWLVLAEGFECLRTPLSSVAGVL